jgi:hypothetical protein
MHLLWRLYIYIYINFFASALATHCTATPLTRTFERSNVRTFTKRMLKQEHSSTVLCYFATMLLCYYMLLLRLWNTYGEWRSIVKCSSIDLYV